MQVASVKSLKKALKNFLVKIYCNRRRTRSVPGPLTYRIFFPDLITKMDWIRIKVAKTFKKWIQRTTIWIGLAYNDTRYLEPVTCYKIFSPDTYKVQMIELRKPRTEIQMFIGKTSDKK